MIQTKKRISLEDAAALRALLGNPTAEICDNSIGNIFMWKDALDTDWLGDGPLCLAEHYDGVTYYALRASDGDYIERIEALLAAEGAPLHLCSLTEREVELLRERFGDRFSCEGDEDTADYLYDAAAFRTYAGKKYHSQKNHMNAFLKTYCDYDFLPCADGNELLAMLDEYEAAVNDMTESALRESEACRRLIPMLPLLDLDTRVLRIGGKTVGFCIMETVGDTLMIHVEKGLPGYRGVYPMLVHLEACAYPDVAYINREEDDGNEGLRRSKRSYHPIRLLQKYIGVIE